MIIDTILTDLDDTLLNAHSQLSDYTLQVMEECKRRGIRLIPASGRTHSSMYSFMSRLNTGMPYIAGNGSEIVGADHQVMEQITLDVDTAKEICAFLRQHDFYVQTYRDETFYYEADCEAARLYKKSVGMEGVAVGDLAAFLDFPPPKILGVNDPEKVLALMPLAEKAFAGRATFTMSKAHYFEAEPPNASKGNAARRLAQLLGDMTPERTIAFGDSLNDISLLAYTPNSVAMGNAREELKRTARYICRPNTEDGLARFVEEHVLRAQS